MAIDLRKEMNLLIEEYGHYVLLQRGNRSLRCRCYDELRQEGDRKCKLCLGKGWVSRIERHKVRYDSAMSATSKPGVTKLAELGPVWTDAKIFYFKHDVPLLVGDVVYEVGWDRRNPKKPTHLIRAYAIVDPYELRGDGGRVEYWSATVKAESINLHIRNIVIRSLGPLKNYELVY